jgi:hypothetical protein
MEQSIYIHKYMLHNVHLTYLHTLQKQTVFLQKLHYLKFQISISLAGISLPGDNGYLP